MGPGPRSVERFASLARSSRPGEYVCRSCKQGQARRRFASAAAATIETDSAPPQSQSAPEEPLVSPSAQPQYTLKAGVVLSRPPILTPEPHPFETAYYLYQRRLNERLVLPFTQYFYYKRGTPAFERWRAKRRERAGAAARDVGAYNAYSDEGWNDEVLTGNQDGKPEQIAKKLIDEEGRAAEFTTEGGDVALAGLKRTTLADEKNDQKSLERSLSRTLYLLVKTRATEGRKENYWAFPAAPMVGKEGLQEAAQRTLASACGVNMNTWFVGSHPIGHLVYHHPIGHRVYQFHKARNTPEIPSPAASDPLPSQEISLAGEKTFFMKSRIMAGQADIVANELGVKDFKWLAKEEVQKTVSPLYWAHVKHMLVEQ